MTKLEKEPPSTFLSLSVHEGGISCVSLNPTNLISFHNIAAIRAHIHLMCLDVRCMIVVVCCIVRVIDYYGFRSPSICAHAADRAHAGVVTNKSIDPTLEQVKI